MGTKTIDTIQSEQIVALEADVAALTTTLNALVVDINQLTPKINTIISNLNNLASCIGNSYSPGGNTSGDGLLKRLTEFDDLFTNHISSKFPPVVDIQGGVRVGYHIDNTPMEHAHPQGWTGSTGTCLAATVTANPSYPGSAIFTNGITNVAFQALASTSYVPTNQTWDGLRIWDTFPTAHLVTNSSGAITSSDFRMDLFGGQSKNSSYGYGWSVNDEMMSMFGGTYSGVWRSAWFATVTSVGSQLQAKPADNTATWRSPAVYHDVNSYNMNLYGDDSPGVGGPAEVADWGEGGSHNIVDESSQSGTTAYTATVSSASTLHSYLMTPAQLLTLSDAEKITRGKQLVRMTNSRLIDSELWGTDNTNDNVLTSADLLT